MKVKIGIVICEIENEKQSISDSYVQAIKSVGALPIVIPLVTSRSALTEYVSLCDGFLFCGGGDITPLLFGEEPKYGLRKTNLSLDLVILNLN